MFAKGLVLLYSIMSIELLVSDSGRCLTRAGQELSDSEIDSSPEAVPPLPT